MPPTNKSRNLTKYRNRHEKKKDDIQKALTHRARLRKKYFKLLKEEGEEIPEKKENTEENDEERARRRAGIAPGSDGEEDAASDQESDIEGDFFEEEKPKNTEKPKERQEATGLNKKPALTYDDRRKLIKDRKRQKREEYERSRKQNLAEKKEKERLRVKHKKQMTKYTPKGQPVMNSRINRLLDKIKENA